MATGFPVKLNGGSYSFNRYVVIRPHPNASPRMLFLDCAIPNQQVTTNTVDFSFLKLIVAFPPLVQKELSELLILNKSSRPPPTPLPQLYGRTSIAYEQCILDLKIGKQSRVRLAMGHYRFLSC